MSAGRASLAAAGPTAEAGLTQGGGQAPQLPASPAIRSKCCRAYPNKIERSPARVARDTRNASRYDGDRNVGMELFETTIARTARADHILDRPAVSVGQDRRFGVAGTAACHDPACHSGRQFDRDLRPAILPRPAL